MGSFTDTAENETLDAWFGATTLGPATWYLRLTTTVPTDTVAGTEVTTVSWTDYAALGVTNNATNFPAAGSGAKSNGVEFVFDTSATVTGANVTVAGVEFWTAASGGTRKAWSTASATVANGNRVSIAAGALTLTQD